MKTVILCGGKGTRMGGVAEKIPKPLIEIGGKPVLWHIMKLYSSQDFKDFILCLGYRGDMIKEYFEKNNHENWNIQFVDTGEDSKKAERILKVRHLINGENFFLSYGDDLANIDFNKLLKFHEYMGVTATITTVRLTSPFGIVHLNEEGLIHKFQETPITLDHWMNGGFMVLNKKIFDILHKGELEVEVFNHLIEPKQICAYKHKGEWKSMNTLKDNIELNDMWANGKAFWKIWND